MLVDSVVVRQVVRAVALHSEMGGVREGRRWSGTGGWCCETVGVGMSWCQESEREQKKKKLETSLREFQASWAWAAVSLSHIWAPGGVHLSAIFLGWGGRQRCFKMVRQQFGWAAVLHWQGMWGGQCCVRQVAAMGSGIACAVVRQAGEAGQVGGSVMRAGTVAISSGLQWKKRSGGRT